MTRRRFVVATVAAVALAGIAAKPFVAHHRNTRNTGVPAPTLTAPPAVTLLATRAAIAALACTSASPAGGNWCGRFTGTRNQATCPDTRHCTVRLIGLLANKTTTLPVALAVTVVSGEDRRWHVTEVTS